MPLTTRPNQHALLHGPASCSSPDGLEDKSLGSRKAPTGVRTPFPPQPEVSTDVLGSHLTQMEASLLSEAALLTKDSLPLEPVLWAGVRWGPWEVGERLQRGWSWSLGLQMRGQPTGSACARGPEAAWSSDTRELPELLRH